MEDHLNRQLDEMSGDPAVAKHLKDSLRRLSDGAAGPALAEMAKDVLAGRTDLRTVGSSSAYASHMSEAIGRFQQWQEQLTPEERDQLLEDTRAHLRAETENKPGAGR